MKNMDIILSFALAICLIIIACLSFNIINDKDNIIDGSTSNNTNNSWDENYCEVYKFDIEEWRRNFPEFSYEINVGEITDPFSAIEKAEKLWMEKLNTYDEVQECANTKKVVYYDIKNKLWMIHGTLPNNLLGPVPVALLEENGNVLAVCVA